MAIKGRKFSKQHLANLRAAHAKRRGKKQLRIQPVVDYKPDLPIGSQLRIRLPEDYKIEDRNPLYIKTNGLIERMTQAIDKIKEQIERLETL